MRNSKKEQYEVMCNEILKRFGDTDYIYISEDDILKKIFNIKIEDILVYMLNEGWISRFCPIDEDNKKQYRVFACADIDYKKYIK